MVLHTCVALPDFGHYGSNGTSVRTASYDFLLVIDIHAWDYPVSFPRQIAILVENRKFYPSRVFYARAETFPLGILQRRG